MPYDSTAIADLTPLMDGSFDLADEDFDLGDADSSSDAYDNRMMSLFQLGTGMLGSAILKSNADAEDAIEDAAAFILLNKGGGGAAGAASQPPSVVPPTTGVEAALPVQPAPRGPAPQSPQYVL